MPDDLSLPTAELDRLHALFGVQRIDVGGGNVVAVRRCGQGLPVVCLHGIGSGSASWVDVALLLGDRAEVIAWDAPGYGESTPLPMAEPRATDYAQRLRELLDALGIDRCMLVGHSLGALTAAAATQAGGVLAGRVARLVLISPARGYGAPDRAAQGAKVREERLATLAQLGIEGSARQRSGRLLSAHADEAAQRRVRWNMARLNEHGYRQAVALLCGDDLLRYLPPALAVDVAVGALDVITPPEACAEVAQACGVPLQHIEEAGHASYVERPQAVAALLAACLDKAAAPAA
ncbi:alpha/beta fold hydrolase [Aquincola tertiaricarbonis]|uniref:alpha/beta fold hydrolase n=1 Tax=Aquincola tertiaricarbonis TaxID=391953 RepID=UPI000614D8F6|nr:alpha/beta fold hydrolase [Aquincola tertiaricarbonis]